MFQTRQEVQNPCIKSGSITNMFQTRQEVQNPGIKSGYRVRYSLRELEYFDQKKNDFLKAWKLIKELPPSNPNSFWSIASYHGMPFKERRVEPEPTSRTWSGYCQHGNVLFPTWHRLYCFRLEQALQTVLPNGDVALHYWDTTSDESVAEGLPPILLQPTVTIDNEPNIPNPLLNFTLPRQIEGSPDSFFTKPKGYTTVRYPYSGMVNPEDAKVIAEKHNTEIDGMNEGSDVLLQENIKWYISYGRPPQKDDTISVYAKFKSCLNTSDYNAFSNTTSAANYDATVSSSLEQPHNDIHLAIGGFTHPGNSNQYIGLISGSNGDMGANECASFDPIFFLHHCNVDRVFWIWQRKWGKQKEITIRKETPGPLHESGTSSNNGPTPNQTPDQELNMETILYPFQDEYGVPRTSNDCVDIEGQLGYTYSRGSLEDKIKPTPPIASTLYSRVVEKLADIENELRGELGVSTHPLKAVFDLSKVVNEYSWWDTNPLLQPANAKYLNFNDELFKRAYTFKVSNLDRDAYPGSFLVLAYEKKGETLNFLGQQGVLDRWDRKSCANCQSHRFASLGFSLAATRLVDPNFIVLKLLYKDPLTGKQNIVELDVNYQPAAVVQQTSDIQPFSAGQPISAIQPLSAIQPTSDIKPTFQIAIQFDEIIN